MRGLFIFLFWSAAIFAFAMAVFEPPFFLPGNPSLRVQHAGAFLTLSALGAAAYERVPLMVLFVLLSTFSGLIELVQMIPALDRTADWTDFAIDTATSGITLFVVSGVQNVPRERNRRLSTRRG